MKKVSEIKQQVQTDNLEVVKISDLLLIIASQIKIIIIIPLIFGIIAALYVQFLVDPTFSSTAKIMSASNTGKSQAVGLAAQFGISIPSTQSETKWVYPELVKSRTLAYALLFKKFDTNKFGEQKTLLQILTYGNEEAKLGIDTLKIKAAEALIKKISIKEDIKTGVYTVGIEAFEPKFAYELNIALLEELDSHQKKYNKASTSRTRQFIEERILETEKELQKVEEDLKDFIERNRRIENSPSLQLQKQRISREVAVLTGVFTTLKQQYETTKIEEVKESNYVIVIDPPDLPLKKSKPSKRKFVLIFLIIGSLIGLFCGFLLYFYKNVTKKNKDFIKAKNLLMKNISELIPFKNNFFNQNG